MTVDAATAQEACQTLDIAWLDGVPVAHIATGRTGAARESTQTPPPSTYATPNISGRQKGENE